MTNAVISIYCSHQNDTLIAIKAPHGTSLEVPDPDEVTAVSLVQLPFLYYSNKSISAKFKWQFYVS